MAEWIRSLEAVVRENRFTIAVVFPAVGAVTLVASERALLPDVLAYNALLLLLGVAVMRSPLVVGLLPLVDRRVVVGLGGLAAYTYAIEVLGVQTGLPYGEFAYEVALGPMLAGVPLALPLLFIPLVLNAYLLALLVLGEWAERPSMRIPVGIALVVAVDLVLDPAAVAVGFWSFDAGGLYYGVPWSNYAGWVLSGTVAIVLVDLSFDRPALLERLERCPFVLDDLVSFVVLWGVINLVYGNAGAVVVATGFALVLIERPGVDIAGVLETAPQPLGMSR